MESPIKLTKADARRALVRHHFEPCRSQQGAFERLRSIQFDPLAPVGCNHDLVLQARVLGYKAGGWEKLAYKDRVIYDGWDKMASLVPFEGWPLRRVIYHVHRRAFEKKIFDDHKDAVDTILKEITDHGPMMPKDFDFQLRKDEWKGSWFGPSVTKQTLRALWHSGLIMTSGRKNGQHIYDLTERVVPKSLMDTPILEDSDAKREIALDRHRAMGILRPAAGPEVWSYSVMYYDKKQLISELAQRGDIVPVDVDGMKAHATPAFLSILDQPAIEPRVVFVAPLDQFMWDRKMVAHVFEFDYVWEVYVPEAKRRWGYYILPVLFGDELVARTEFYCRDGTLELRQWHYENRVLGSRFYGELEHALKSFMRYCSASNIRAASHIDKRIRDLVKAMRR